MRSRKTPSKRWLPSTNARSNPAALREEAWQRDLRRLRMELDQLANSGLVDDLQAAVGERRRLIRVDDDVTRVGVAVRQEPFTDEQRRDAVPEAGLDRPNGSFSLDPA